MTMLTPPFTLLLAWPQRWLLLGVLLALAAVVMFGRLGPLDEVLKTREPGGILALEFAWSGERAAGILAAWKGLEAVVRLQTRWDYLFLLCYPLALSLACAMLADAPHNPVPMIGAFCAAASLSLNRMNESTLKVYDVVVPGAAAHRKSLPGTLPAARNSPLAQSPMSWKPALPWISMAVARFQSRPGAPGSV